MMMILKLKMARKTAKNNNRGVCSRRPVQNFVDTAPAKDLSYADATRPLEGDEVPFPKVRMFSPIEMNYAFVFAAYRDHDDPQKMEEWKRLVCFENTPSFIHIGMCLRVAILPIRHFLTVSFAYRMDDVSLDEPPGFNIIKHFPSENYPQTWCPQPVMLSSARALLRLHMFACQERQCLGMWIVLMSKKLEVFFNRSKPTCFKDHWTSWCGPEAYPLATVLQHHWLQARVWEETRGHQQWGFGKIVWG